MYLSATGSGDVMDREVSVVDEVLLTKGPDETRHYVDQSGQVELAERIERVRKPPMQLIHDARYAVPEIARSVSIATASCVASSTIVRHLTTRPSAVRSNTKSMDHTSLA